MKPNSDTKPHRFKLLADFGLIYAAAIWGATFFVVKESLNSIDPVVLVGYRFLLAAATMAVVVLVTKRKLWYQWKPGVTLGVMLWLLYITQTIGLKYTTASSSGFITGLFVAFVPVFTFFMNRNTKLIPQLPAVILSLIGLWMLTGGLQDINRGDVLTLGAAMAYAGHLLYADRYIKRGVDPYAFSFQQFLVVGLLSIITGLIFNLSFQVANIKTVGTIVFLAWFPTVSAFVIQMVAQKIVPPLRVALIFALEPVFAAIFAWTIGGEVFVLHRALGGLLIFSAMLLAELPAFKAKQLS